LIVDAQHRRAPELLVGDGEEPSFELVLRQGRERLFERCWLPRLEAGGVGIQICPLYGTSAPMDRARERSGGGASARRRGAARVCLDRSADLTDSRVRLILSMEAVKPLDGNPGAFEDWYDRGRPALVGALRARGYDGERLERELAEDPSRGPASLTSCRAAIKPAAEGAGFHRLPGTAGRGHGP